MPLRRQECTQPGNLRLAYRLHWAVAVGQRRDVRRVYDHLVIAENFIACDRGQSLLLAPDLTDWVPEDHMVWSILGAVEQMDLSALYGAYRKNGQGRAAYEPSMMGRVAALRGRAREPVVAGDRAGMPRGRDL